MSSRLRLFTAALGAGLLASCSPQVDSQTGPTNGVTLFDGARLIVGDGSAIDDSAFIVENGKFTSVGKNGDVQLPAGAARVDLAGKTVMPAIVDAHGHLGFLDAVTGKLSKANFTRENYIDHLQRYAYHGVAATISTGTDIGDLAYQLREEVIPNAALIRTVGRGLAWPGSGPTDPSRNDVPYSVTSVAEARKAVQDLAPHKPDFVKIWVDDRNGKQKKLTPEIYTAAADEAHKQNLPAIAHVFDLEDATAPSEKVPARAVVAESLTSLDLGRRAVAVRVNGTDTQWCYRDVVEVVEQAGDRLDTILIPKVGTPADVLFVATTVLLIGATRSTVLNTCRIAAPSPTISEKRVRPGAGALSAAPPAIRAGVIVRCSRSARSPSAKGLVTKSIAPRLIALTASSTPPQPVITIDRISG